MEASTGPRPRGRGMQPNLVVGRAKVSVASTGPRPRGRGMREAARKAKPAPEASTIGVGMEFSAPPLPPNRTGPFRASGFPVSGFSCEIGSLALGLWLRRIAPVRRSRHWASVDGRVPARVRVPCAAFAEWPCSRPRIHWSSLSNTFLMLCLKYSNQPRNVRFTSPMISPMLPGLKRPVFCRIVSLNLSRLFWRGQRWPRSK